MIYIDIKTGNRYKIISNNARLKDSNGKWIDCVIYAPMYANAYDMFARERKSFEERFKPE